VPVFKSSNADYINIDIDGTSKRVFKAEKFDSFDLSILGLGDVKQKSQPIESLAAVFDLEGFTNFCGQIDPQLSVPIFLQSFLSWVLDQIKKETTKKKYSQGYELWNALPFYTKFLGDGLLIIWDTSKMSPVAIRNVIVSAEIICGNYLNNFYPDTRRKLVNPPAKLRCGLALGRVFSVGEGNDYVGACINVAARLQKLPGITFAFNTKGIDMDEACKGHGGFFKNSIVTKEVTIRGISQNEKIGIKKVEFENMSPEDRKLYKSS
jgi:hypothetical protein